MDLEIFWPAGPRREEALELNRAAARRFEAKGRSPDNYRVFAIAKRRDDDGNEENAVQGVDRKLNSGR
jgi:hypothetical protein